MHPIETPDKTFHDGDGVSELGTILPAWWLNQVQSELLAVLTAAGIRPDKAKPNQVVEALRKIIDEQADGKGLPVGAVIGFPRAVTNQEGYLKADGSTFNQSTSPDRYRVLGSNKLRHNRRRWFCSEWCATALRLPESWRWSPNDLAAIVPALKRQA